MLNFVKNKCIFFALCSLFGVGTPTYAQDTFKFKQRVLNLRVIDPSQKSSNYSFSSDYLSFSPTQSGVFSSQTVAVLNQELFELGPVDIHLATNDGVFKNILTNCNTLLINQQCQITLDFYPQDNTTYTNNIIVTGLNMTTKNIVLSGQGLGQAYANLTFNPGSQSDLGLTPVGQKKQTSLTFKNTGNVPDKNIFVTSTGQGLSIKSTTCGTNQSPVTIAAGDSCSITLEYVPTDKSALSGEIRVMSNALQGTNAVNVTGTGGLEQLEYSASTIDFGVVEIGNHSSRSLSILNSGNISTESTTLALSGSSVYQTLVTSCATQINPGVTCSATIDFYPTTVGPLSGAVTVKTAAGENKTITLSGTGAGQANVAIDLKPGYSSDFGYVKVNSSAYAEYLFRNNGSIAATNVYPSVTGSNISITLNTCGSQGAPGLLVPGGSCSIGITYSPTSVSQLAGAVLTVNSSATLGTNTVTFSGYGSSPVAGLSIAPGSSTDFGTVWVGNNATRYFVFTNTGDVRVNNVYAIAGGLTVALSDNTCGTSSSKISLDPGSNCTVGLIYTPTVNSTLYNASITVESDALAGNKSFAMTGQGEMARGVLLQQSGFSPDYGTVVVNNGTIQKFIFQNQGGAVATNVYATVSGAGYSITSNTCGTNEARTSIAAAYSCSITVQFNSATIGTFNGSLSVYSSAPNSPSTLALTANVITAPSGEKVWIGPTTATFVVPANVYSVSAVVIGGGGAMFISNSNNMAGGGGGALAYVNNMAVSPGQEIVIRAGGAGVYNGSSTDSPGGSYSQFGDIISLGGGGAKQDLTPGQGGIPSGPYTAGFKGGAGTRGNWETMGAGSSAGYTADGIAGAGNGIGIYPGYNQGFGRGDNGNWYNGRPSNSTQGAVRVIWGPGRSFPLNAD